jgi:hypothetical protein
VTITQLGTPYNTPGIAYAVALKLDSAGTILLAYVADGTDGLKVLSLSNPSAPSLLGSLKPTAKLVDIAVSEDPVSHKRTACMANQNGSVYVLDVTSASALKILGVASLYGTCQNISMDETDPTRVVAISSSTTQGGDIIEVFDITNPAQPHREEPPAPVGEIYAGQDVALTGGFAYVAASTEGLKIYDVSSGTPSLVSPVVKIPGDAYGVSLDDSFAYVTGFPSILIIIDIYAE